MEPYLKAKVVLDKLGNGTLVVNITPDHLMENHKFTFEVDQSYLLVVIRELKDIIDKYPIKGNKLKALYHKVRKKFE